MPLARRLAGLILVLAIASTLVAQDRPEEATSIHDRIDKSGR